jgi:predicted NAD-dependent protein-ADP-ribosyltransferase YbiA (DUF1768 family)
MKDEARKMGRRDEGYIDTIWGRVRVRVLVYAEIQYNIREGGICYVPAKVGFRH